MALVELLVVMLRHPLLVAVLGLVVAVLFGAGRAFGLPLLFWHERSSHRFLAGLATTLLAAELLFVAYLLAGQPTFAGGRGLLQFMALGGGCWLLLVGAAAARRAGRYARAPGGEGPRMSPEPGLAPAVAAPASARGAPLQSVQVPVTAFVLGVVLAALVVVMVLGGSYRVTLPPRMVGLIARLPGAAHTVAPQLHLAAAFGYVGLLAAFILMRRCATPAVGLCLLLALLAAANGAIAFWLGNVGLGLLVLIGLLWLAGTRLFRVRVPALQEFYARPVPYPPPSDATAPAPALLPGFALPGPRDARPRRLIAVCASGGGIRAAAWTAAILGRLDEIPGARPAVRIITGASGGMMGAASWVTSLRQRGGDPTTPAPPGSWPVLMDAVAMDSLTPAARRLVFRDLPMAFLPFDNLHDRGRALEDAWRLNLARSPLALDLGLTLGDLRGGEEDGRWPSLVFSPMLVEDGRRLIISNLDLTPLLDNEVRWLSSRPRGPAAQDRASRGAYQLAELFPTTWADFPVATAARLSASFPYVSPATLLPTCPRRRVVDAGYFDNYGLDLVCNWLREALDCRRPAESFGWDQISGILVLQIRDNVSQLSVNPDSDPPPLRTADARGPAAALSRGLESLSTPPEALLAAREAVSLFRNDAELETLSRLYAAATGDPDFLTSTVFEFRGEASLSWYLTSREVGTLAEQAAAPGLTAKLEAIARWAQA